MNIRDARTRIVLVCLGLWVASFALYAPTLSFEFVNFDDHRVLLSHPNLYNEDSLSESLYEIFVGYFPREEPLLVRDVSWALDARLFGFQNPLGYHLGNVLLNACNSVLLLLFLLYTTRRLDLAVSVACLFTLLAVHVEPVSWVMGRKDLLSAFWMLMALLCQSLELRQPESVRRKWLYLATIPCTGLALFSKMSSASFFVVLALHRVLQPYLIGERRPAATLVLRPLLTNGLRVLPHALLSVAGFLWFSGILREWGVIGSGGPGVTDPSHLVTVARFAPLIVGQYMQHLFWPDQLSLYYRWPHVEIALTPLQLWLSLGTALALLACVVYCGLRRRDLVFYPLAFLALLIPHLGLFYVGIWLADRYIYFASLFVLAGLATLLLQLWDRSGRSRRYAVAAVAIAFALVNGTGTLRQQPIWRDNDTLWRYEAYLDEPSLFAIQALAKSHVQKAEAESDPARRAHWVVQAKTEIARGLARDRALGRRPGPYHTPDQLQLARLHYLQGKLSALEGESLEAQLGHFTTAHRLAPDRVSALMLAGRYFELASRVPEPEREGLVRRSFAFFAEHVRYSSGDPIRLAKSIELLSSNYEGRFPFLAPEIREMKGAYLQ